MTSLMEVGVWPLGLPWWIYVPCTINKSGMLRLHFMGSAALVMCIITLAVSIGGNELGRVSLARLLLSDG